jgi:hypothetical protein
MHKFNIDVKFKSRLSFFYSLILLISILFYVLPVTGSKGHKITAANYSSDPVHYNYKNWIISSDQFGVKASDFNTTAFPERNIIVFQDLMMKKNNRVII